MSYKIISDSCCDYTDFGDRLSWLKRVPLSIVIDKEEFIDDSNLSSSDLLRKIATSKHAAKTACPSIGLFLKELESSDDFYIVTLSEKMSGSYNSALAASKILNDSWHNKNVHVFNSKSAAAGQVLICIKIHQLASSGLSFCEVVEKTEEFIRGMSTLFVLENLETLRKNGRLTNLQSLITSALKIKLLLGADSNGAIEVIDKALSVQASIKKLVGIITSKCSSVKTSNKVLVITHCNCAESAKAIKKSIEKHCKFKDIIICRASGISTVYANSGGIIVAF